MLWHDDQYLFRITSTFGWEDVISICDSLVFGIETAASTQCNGGLHDNEVDADEEGSNNGYFNDYFNDQNRNEKSLQQWLREGHAQLFYLDQWGNCPLHAASYVKPPLNVIEALFRVGRALWKYGPHFRGQTPIWETSSTDGSTPFLVACSTGASTSVLHAYLDEIELYIDQKWVHPQYARMLVIQPDNQGTNPLMGWMSFHHSWIKRQLEQGNGSMPNSNNQSSSHHHIPRRIGEQGTQSLLDYWNIACRILLFATMNIRPHAPPSTPVLVHRCAAIAIYCPVSLLEWIVAPRQDDKGWAPGDESAATLDNLGKLPIHRALEAVDFSSIFDEDIVHHGADFDGAEEEPDTDIEDTTSRLTNSAAMPPATMIVAAETVCPRMEAILYNNPKLESNRVQIIKKMLQWHPRAATAPFPNGRTPLVQAIAHGGSWHGSDPANDNLGLLRLLWGYAPEQSLDIDPITGLYPFMLAATIRYERNKRNEMEKAQTDTVYNLLRKDPQLVFGALIRNA